MCAGEFSVTGKCPCGPGKKKGGKGKGKGQKKEKKDEGGDDAGGPGAECAKHKDCPKTDFCSQEGCRKCKQCEEGASSAQARAESSGPHLLLPCPRAVSS